MRRNCRVAPLSNYHSVVTRKHRNPILTSPGYGAWIADTLAIAACSARCATMSRQRWNCCATSRRRVENRATATSITTSSTAWTRRGPTVSLRTRVRELLSGGQYQPSEPALFHEILDSLPVAVDGFTFIDLGSGKGRTLLMASEYPFRRIIGVEFLRN